MLSRLKDVYRVESSNDTKLKVFTESHSRLLAWMSQKQKMTSLLTPVGSDPAMIDNQIRSAEVSIYLYNVYQRIKDSHNRTVLGS